MINYNGVYLIIQDDYNSEEDEEEAEDEAPPPGQGTMLGSPVVVQIDSPDVGQTPSPQVVVDSVNNTPRTPRGQTLSTATDDESVSEWEVERIKVEIHVNVVMIAHKYL